MNIEVHIERLVVDGLPIAHHQGSLLQTAVEEELTRLLAADGMGSSLLKSGIIAQLPARGIQLTGKSDPTILGQQIGQAVYGGIKR